MEKTINIGGKDVRLNNNVGWAFEYRDQFGHDIIPSLMPLLAGAVEAIGALVAASGKKDSFEIADIAKLSGTGALDDAFIRFSGIEFTEAVNITWALAKNADESIEEPRRWVKQFDTFPVDEILPEIIRLIIGGLASTKNSERLQRAVGSLKPKKKPNKPTSTKSPSQESNED